MKRPNDSEKQLHLFLNHIRNSYTTMSLQPQGDETMISQNQVNLCTVTNNGKEYRFGGISDSYYMRMVAMYDWREDGVRESRRIIN